MCRGKKRCLRPEGLFREFHPGDQTSPSNHFSLRDPRLPADHEAQRRRHPRPYPVRTRIRGTAEINTWVLVWLWTAASPKATGQSLIIAQMTGRSFRTEQPHSSRSNGHRDRKELEPADNAPPRSHDLARQSGEAGILLEMRFRFRMRGDVNHVIVTQSSPVPSLPSRAAGSPSQPIGRARFFDPEANRAPRFSGGAMRWRMASNTTRN